MQLAPSLHRIGSDIVACYLVEEGGGITVIDTGLPGHWKDLNAELDAMGRSIAEVRGAILTHGDSDHLGFADRLRNEAHAPIYVHEADAPQARGESKKANPPWGKIRIGPLLGFLWYAARKGGLKVPVVREVVTFASDGRLDLPGAPEIIHIPGHSPGSVAIHMPGVRALFVGDALTTRHVLTGVTAPQPAPFTLDPGRALESLSRIEHLDVDWVLPGHGPPFRGGAGELARQVRNASG